MERRTIRCRKCRKNLDIGCYIDTRCQQNIDSIFFIRDDHIPDWILSQVILVNWTKGKVNCEKCGGRLGSFDFTVTKKCQRCGGHDVSPIHIQQNRVDVIVPLNIGKEYLFRSLAAQSDKVIGTESGSVDGVTSVHPPDLYQTEVTSNQGKHLEDKQTQKLEMDLTKHNDKIAQHSEVNRMFSLDSNFSMRQRNTRDTVCVPEFPNGPNTFVQASSESEEKSGGMNLKCNMHCNNNINQTLDLDFINQEGADICRGERRPNKRERRKGRVCSTNVHVSSNEIAEEMNIRVDTDQNPFTVLSETKDNSKTDGTTEDTTENLATGTSQAQTQTETSVPVEYCCAVCLDLLFRPHHCLPCKHTFCEPCLRLLARMKPGLTQCPLCRDIIMQCQLDKHLELKLREDYPAAYKKRRQHFRKINDRFYQLPSCSKLQYNRAVAFDMNNIIFNDDNHIRTAAFRYLLYIFLVLAFVFLAGALIYCMVKFIGLLIVTLDTSVMEWCQTANNYQHAQFPIYNILKIAIHAYSWCNLYYQARHYAQWYHYIVFVFHIYSVAQVNLLRCTLGVVCAELVSRFIVRRQRMR